MPGSETPAAQAPIAPSGIDPAFAGRVQHAVDAHDYATAERLLLDEINIDPHSRRAAALLVWIGSIYLENQDAMSAAVAWNKSKAIVPLDPKLQFSLAMAYVSIKRPDWARQQLEKLAAADPASALYVYWLGRLDYDGHLYPSALRRFQQAIALDPTMARAYDNLGLVYYYQNQNAQAVESFKKAIELDRSAPHPSPWPYLNLAITEQFLNQDADAETHLREAIRLDSALPQVHFQLGTVLEDGNRLDDAVTELKRAAQLDAAYPEPHMALARVYHKLGQEAAARDEVQIYKRLHTPSAPQK
ncbi:MAG TPA: tetratricopeptide repeat protein [Terracidiphilus sp.]|nr:tetratricopeptide repeat protein [Terracidiphilus sp.]